MARITIELDTNSGDTLEKAIKALGQPQFSLILPDRVVTSDHHKPTDVVTRGEVRPVTIVSAGTAYTSTGAGCAVAPEVVVKSPSPTEPPLSDMDGDRKRGEPGPGHRRRTNAQIEEDRLWMAQKTRAEAALAAMDKGVHDEMKIEGVSIDTSGGGASFTSTDKRVYIDDNLQPVISTGGERINPEDAADEAAETAARPATDAPTLEDLRAEVAKYIDKYGHAASVKNMRAIIGCAVADCFVAEIPAAIAKVRAALEDAPAAEPESLFGGEPAEPATATAAEVVEAIKAYARKFDGTDTDQDAMVLTKEDLPKVFVETFGKGVTGLGSLPDKRPETLGKILVAIMRATDKNTFKREAKS